MIDTLLHGPMDFSLGKLLSWFNDIWLVIIGIFILLTFVFTLIAWKTRKKRKFSSTILGMMIGMTFLILFIELIIIVLWLTFDSFPLHVLQDVNIFLLLFPPMLLALSLFLANRIIPLRDIPWVQKIKAFAIICGIIGFIVYILIKTHILVFVSLFNWLALMVVAIIVIYVIYKLILKKR